VGELVFKYFSKKTIDSSVKNLDCTIIYNFHKNNKIGTIFDKATTMTWKVSLLIFFLLSNFIFGQETNNSAEIKREFAELDSIAVDDLYVHDTVLLEGAKILHVNLKTEMEKKYYIWLSKRVRDVWPYVKIAVDEYNSIQDTAQYFTNKRQKKKYIKQRQNKLANQFEKQFSDMYRSTDQILRKLIHRETRTAPYGIITELRGGTNACRTNAAGAAHEFDFNTPSHPPKLREHSYLQVTLPQHSQARTLERI